MRTFNLLYRQSAAGLRVILLFTVLLAVLPWQVSAGLAVGKIVGTNLVNLLLILGLSALIAPLTLDTRTVRFDLPC